MQRIYVAGAYSANNVIDVLANIRQGIMKSADLLNLGYAVFCPHLDFQFALSPYGSCLTVEDYQVNSMAWLEVSDVVYVLPNSENSKGVSAEIARAVTLNIPVVFSIEELSKIRDLYT